MGLLLPFIAKAVAITQGRTVQRLFLVAATIPKYLQEYFILF